ncbi:hypothetical protein M1116_01305 [Patescibacteria group bacterium]|nr:hypothetical protein [Patescibacteria group bacterium]
MYPKRLPELAAAVKSARADWVALIDTYRWKRIFTEKEIGEHFGYQKVFSIDLNDGRMKNFEADSGITVMTNFEQVIFQTVRLDNCQAIKTEIREEEKTWEIFAVYLEVVEEEIRKAQIKALLQLVDPKKATILIGDFNSIDGKDLSWPTKCLLRSGAKVIGDRTFKRAIPEMMRGEGTALIKAQGFQDADPKRRPTIPSKLFVLPIPFPLLRLDYGFYNQRVKPINFEVLRGPLFEKTSDHYPILWEVK